MITIKLRPGQDPNKAIQKLKNVLINESLFEELKKRKYYSKPSKKKRLKSENAAKQKVKDFRKLVRKAEQEGGWN
jgi:ribosomal protein S21|tara:strand:+ start:114 stop:338 length:225 start_codon:yes stop_codon:yes gene_type:complete